PGNEAPNRVARRIVRTARADETKNRLHDLLAYGKAANQGLRPQQKVRREDALRRFLIADGGEHQHLLFGFAVGVADVNLQEEAVELRCGKWIRAFLLEGILRCQHVEWTLDVDRVGPAG